MKLSSVLLICVWIVLVGIPVYATTGVTERVCQTGETLCELADGQYGCCPYPNAVCCYDQGHCCPFGYDCVYKACVRQKGMPSVILNFSLTVTPKEMSHFDRSEDSCSSEFTPCPNSENGQPRYCCPMPNAVCCKNQQHCCPTGSKCNAQKDRCEWEAIATPFIFTKKYFPVKSNKQVSIKMVPAMESDTPCPNPYFSCPPNNTCCLNHQVKFVCCPFKDAACCSEGSYCCPFGTYCAGASRCNPIRK